MTDLDRISDRPTADLHNVTQYTVRIHEDTCENQEYCVLPWVDIRREIVRLRLCTKLPGYPIRWREEVNCVCLAGYDVVEIFK